MTDSDNTASVAIALETTSPISKITYAIEARDGDGKPVAGQDVSLTIEGDGSFAANFPAKELTRTTDENGTAQATWFRSGIYLRRVKATVAVTLPVAGTVTLTEVDDEGDKVWISWKKEELRISRPPV